jgi:spore coat protein CotF
VKAISILALLAASMLVGQAQTLTTETQSPKSTRLSEDGPNERVEFSGAVAELWRSGDFESLERMSTQLRTKKL